MDNQFGLDFNNVPAKNIMTVEKKKVLDKRAGIPAIKTRTDTSKEAAERHRAGVIKKTPVLSNIVIA